LLKGVTYVGGVSTSSYAYHKVVLKMKE